MLHTPTDGRSHVHESKTSPSSSLDPSKQIDREEAEALLLAYDPPRDEYRVRPASLCELSFRHSGWRDRRRLVFEGLRAVHVSAQRLDRFAQCGAGCVVEHHPESGDWRIRASYCRDRVCQACGSARSARIAANLCEHAHGRNCRFVTLTLRHNRTPLSDQISRVYTAFSTLRRRKWFKACVTGGVAFLEVKIGRDGLWHVHLHCLWEGTFFHQRELSAEWYAVTGDSSIVDVRSISTDQKEVRYAAAYAGKPLDASIVREPPRLHEFITAIKGRRLALTFGTWRGLDVDAVPPDADVGWVPIGSLDRLWRDAAAGDAAAQSVLTCLARRSSIEAGSHKPTSPDG